MASRPAGSRPLVGSSSSSTGGSWISACASLSRCFMPVEYSSSLPITGVFEFEVGQDFVGTPLGLLAAACRTARRRGRRTRRRSCRGPARRPPA